MAQKNIEVNTQVVSQPVPTTVFTPDWDALMALTAGTPNDIAPNADENIELCRCSACGHEHVKMENVSAQ